MTKLIVDKELECIVSTNVSITISSLFSVNNPSNSYLNVRQRVSSKLLVVFVTVVTVLRPRWNFLKQRTVKMPARRLHRQVEMSLGRATARM